MDIQIEGECEASFIEIVTNSPGEKNVIVGSLYRHPHDNFNEFFTSFSNVIEKKSQKVLGHYSWWL